MDRDMEAIRMNNNIEMNEEVKRKIDTFTSKKRREVMEALYPNHRIPHGELAKAIDSPAASLSNILLNFENFEYALIDSVSEGKRRYYYLTKLGREYVESCRRLEKSGEKGKIIRDALQMIQKAKESLNEFQALEDEWEIGLEDALIARIECRRVSENESQKAVDEFIKYAECALVTDYDNQIVNVLRLLQDNSILQIRFSRFIEKFDWFRPVLEVWENGIDALQMYELLNAAVSGSKDKGRSYAEMPEWDEEYNRLTEGIRYVAERADRTDTSMLYECFNRYLAGNQILSGFLAREVFFYYGEKKSYNYEGNVE